MPKFTNYRGWNVLPLENRWIKLMIAPDLGGRIIQMSMNDHEYFFVNPLLEGYEPDTTRLGKDGIWLNFGGEKIWPAPQGWNSPDHWPGPPDPVLDSGTYSLDEASHTAGGKGVTLTSPFDSYTGLQIIKDVSLSESRSEIIVQASFCNKSHVPVKWSVWPVCQMNTLDTGIENQYRIICPVNPESRYIDGYKVMHGLVNNPQFQKDANGHLMVSYQYLAGKIGLDTNAGWTAFTDTKSGKVFVLKFQYEEDQSYPDDTSVQIWTSGKGMVYSRNRIIEHKDDKQLNPPYMEMELLSPVKEIEPGESIQLEYHMLACTIPGNRGVRNINPYGVTASPLRIETAGDEILITGEYGVFSDGIIKMRIKDAAGNALGGLHTEKAGPFEGINIKVSMSKEKWLFEQGSHISVDFFDENDRFAGEIDEMELNILK